MPLNYFKFLLWLFVAAGVGFIVHREWFQLTDPEADLDMLAFAYKFNAGITLLLTTTMILGGEKFKEQLGFIFLVSGVIKLGVYIFLINNKGFSLDKSNFLHFFIPYALCVIVEMTYIIKILNSTNFSKDK